MNYVLYWAITNPRRLPFNNGQREHRAHSMFAGNQLFTRGVLSISLLCVYTQRGIPPINPHAFVGRFKTRKRTCTLLLAGQRNHCEFGVKTFSLSILYIYI